MAAEVLSQGGANVTVYDGMPSVGRKFLLAGRGGLNLTHSEALPEFLTRYGEAMPLLGSDGAWVNTLAARGVAISPLKPANGGFTVAWSDVFRNRFEGHPLKS